MNELIRTVVEKFKRQKLLMGVKYKCPHCDKPIEFEFEHKQNTTVETKLVDIRKGQ